ncbi:autotransporter domain-containing protein [Bordetella sp. N]|uniref:autotransporter domain-containing protein n=1 Tax=Bordetella sp. N TaxID=1746199 RepID=UPI0007102652|nr:autotransporter domain-containing protein [Bordetella sp. N]ALM86037.1 hypothetical protein ASB57_26540 [Bordetella sp. N]
MQRVNRQYVKGKSRVAANTLFPRQRLTLALTIALPWWSGSAMAACTPVSPTAGATVTCSGPANPLSPSYSATADDLTVNMPADSSAGVLLGVGGTVMTLTGNEITLNNAGTIDPALLGSPSILSSGAVVGNGNASIVRIDNMEGGLMRGTSLDQSGNLNGLTGLALTVQNGTGGTSIITNEGTISGLPIVGNNVAAADIAVVAAYGGAQVYFINSGTITGRIAFQSPGTAGLQNTFTNAGTIDGSVSLGVNGENTFTAVSGSSVNAAGGTGQELNVIGLPGTTLSFAPTGTVDGGAGGDNTLVLQNVLPSAGTGSGTGGAATTISGATYINFQHLTVNSGTWTIPDAVVSDDTTIDGGQLTLNGSGVDAYTGSIQVNGGTLFVGDSTHTAAAVTGDVTVSQGTLSGYGTVQGNVTVTNGGTLTAGGTSSIGTLTIDGDLDVQAGTQLIFDAGVPGPNFSTPGQSDRIVVGGALSIDASSLTVNDIGSMGPGLYNLFQWGSTLSFTNGGFTPPAGSSLQILSSDKQINLIVTQGQTLNTWNANGLASPGAMGGGSGTWTVVSNTWADTNGTSTGPMSPQPAFAIFGGASGTVSVDNTNGDVSATGLQFMTDGYHLTGDALTLVGDNGAVPVIRVSSGATAVIDNLINGSTGINKTDGGTLVLNGANIYAGNTVLTGGTLSVSSDLNLGLSANALDFEGGILQVTGTAYNQTARNIIWGSAGGGFDITDLANTFTVSQVLDGAGGLYKTGAGTLQLTGANTYSGGTTVAQGTLRGDTLSLQGNIANNASLVFDQGQDGTYEGVLSGSGVLTKEGVASLVLSADSSAYAGSTQLQAGSLEVNGSLGGTLTVQSGSILSGVGTVGTTSIAAGGTLLPGNTAQPMGTLTVNGNLAFTSGAVYQVRTDASGAHSGVHVTGSASLAGSVLDLGQDGSYAASTRYGILRADGGISGSFQDVSSNLAYLTPSLAYGSNTVDLLMNLKQVPVDNGGGTGDDGGTSGGTSPTRTIRFADYATNHNQRVTANALQSLPESSALYTRVLNLAEGEPAAVFASLSGEGYASTMRSLQGVADRVSSLPLSHLQANLGAGSLPGPATAQLGGGDAATLPQSAAQPVWAQVFGSWRNQSGNGETVRTSESDSGIFIGGDHAVGAGWRVGGALGYTDSQTRLRDLGSRSDVDSYSVTVYGGKAFDAGPGKINLSLGAAYTWHDVKARRGANAAGVSQELKSSYGASTGQFFSELGYALPLNDRVTLDPFLGASYNDLRTRGFSESGGDAALDGKSGRNQVASTTLGLHVQSTFDSAGAAGRVRATLSWRHAYGDVNPATTLAFQGSQTFTVTGAPIARDSAVVELGVDMAVTKRTTVGVNYGGQFGSGSRQNAGSLDVRYRF